MSYPTKYTRQYDYVSYQNANPARPLPADKVHADLNQAALSTSEIVDFLKTSLRADGAIANGSVGIDQLTSSVAAMIGDTATVDTLVEAAAQAEAAADTATAAAGSASSSSGTASAAAVNAAASASAAATSEINAASTLANAVVGAASSTDGEIMLFSGTTGKIAKRSNGISGILKAASGVLSAAVNLTDYFLPARGSDIASASTVNLDSATGDLVDITGTTTITAITLADGAMRTVRFTGVLTLTHGASLVLPGGANIITAAGDFAVFRGYSGGVVRCVSYTLANMAEEITSTVTVASPVALTTAVDAVWNTVSIPRAGLWEVGGNVGILGTSGSTVFSHMHADHNATGQTTIRTAPGGGTTTAFHITSNQSNGWIFPLGTARYRTTGAVTVRFVVLTDFTGGTAGAYGVGWARRVAP